jgi:hypothetical protein
MFRHTSAKDRGAYCYKKDDTDSSSDDGSYDIFEGTWFSHGIFFNGGKICETIK